MEGGGGEEGETGDEIDWERKSQWFFTVPALIPTSKLSTLIERSLLDRPCFLDDAHAGLGLLLQAETRQTTHLSAQFDRVAKSVSRTRNTGVFYGLSIPRLTMLESLAFLKEKQRGGSRHRGRDFFGS